MAHIAAPGSITHNAPAHGTKRRADTSLENEQRLSKRFDLLNLTANNGTRLYIPVPGSSDPRTTAADVAPISAAHPLTFTKRPRAPRTPRTSATSDTMQVDDSPHRVYIHDLAAELSDIESDEENPIFLSDIEKHLSKIPKHVLLGPEPKPREDNQVVLYSVPSSLSVPVERDGVRKAIVESRRRIREGMASKATELETEGMSERRIGLDIPRVEDECDGDAMDLD